MGKKDGARNCWSVNYWFHWIDTQTERIALIISSCSSFSFYTSTYCGCWYFFSNCSFSHFLLQVLVTFYTLHINTGAGTGRSYFFGSFNALWLLLLGVSWFNFNFHCHDYVDFNDIRHCDCCCWIYMISGSKGGIAGHLGDGDLLGRPLHQLHPTNCAQVNFFLTRM